MLKDDDEEETIRNQYLISVEQELMTETSNLMAAIFFTIAAHYIFNLSYHRKAGDLWLFIQEKILGLASKAGTKRNPPLPSTSVVYNVSMTPWSPGGMRLW